MMTIRSPFLAIAVIGSLASAPGEAAEVYGNFLDLRVGFQEAHGNYHMEIEPSGTEGDARFDKAHRYSLLWQASTGLGAHGGCVWGLGGVYNYNDGDLNRMPFEFKSWAIDVHLGYALPLSDHVQVEAVPYLGFGRSYVYTPDDDHGGYGKAADGYFEYGVDVNATYTFHRGYQIGLTVGVLGYDLEIAQPSSGRNFKIDSLDVTGGLFLGIRR
jgi:hypothetical protein